KPDKQEVNQTRGLSAIRTTDDLSEGFPRPSLTRGKVQPRKIYFYMHKQDPIMALPLTSGEDVVVNSDTLDNFSRDFTINVSKGLKPHELPPICTNLHTSLKLFNKDSTFDFTANPEQVFLAFHQM